MNIAPILYILLAFMLECNIPEKILSNNWLAGQWTSTYKYNVEDQFGNVDSIHTTVLNFSNGNFTVNTYLDSFMLVPDTNYSGTYSASYDSLFLTPGNFEEVHAISLDNGVMYLNTEYMIDVNGVVIGDFNSVVWCAVRKKRGYFYRG